jgi:hypothetical protein
MREEAERLGAVEFDVDAPLGETPQVLGGEIAGDVSRAAL